MTYRYGLLESALVASVLLGCFPIGTSETETYRAALPIRESATLDGPESGASATTSGSDGADAAAGAPISKYYAFTREIRDGVNRVTAQVLGTVWYLVQTNPSSVKDDQATWGPYSDPLEPATFRFRVSRIRDEEYRYVLEGRPKDSNEDADYRIVLDGTGYGRNDDRHGDGTFSLDLDTAKALDPVAHANDSGTITITHDLPKSVTEEFAPLPRRVDVDMMASESGSSLSITSLAREDHTGLLTLSGLANIDESRGADLEDVAVASQWNAGGAGRADVSISGGNFSASVTAVECWDRHFKQSYYVDSAGAEPKVGSLDDCAFAAAAAIE